MRRAREQTGCMHRIKKPPLGHIQRTRVFVRGVTASIERSFAMRDRPRRDGNRTSNEPNGCENGFRGCLRRGGGNSVVDLAADDRPAIQSPRGAVHLRNAESRRRGLLDVSELRGGSGGVGDDDCELAALARRLRRPELFPARSRCPLMRFTSIVPRVPGRTSRFNPGSRTGYRTCRSLSATRASQLLLSTSYQYIIDIGPISAGNLQNLNAGETYTLDVVQGNGRFGLRQAVVQPRHNICR